MLGLIITYKCNAECPICLLESSPKSNETMSLSDAYRIIEESAEVGFKQIGIVGGEPMIYYDNVLKIIERSKENDFKFISVSTNGFWAKDKAKCKEVLNELVKAGLNHMCLSADEFHSKFVPYECIRNILDCAKDMNIYIELNSVVTKNSDRLSEIAKELGESLLGYNICEHPCSPVGRAEYSIAEDEFFLQDSYPIGKCRKQDTLTIHPDGRVYPCCCPTKNGELLYIGSTNENNISELMEIYKKNIYAALIRHRGTKWFLDFINDESSIKIKKKYVGLCDFCGDLFLKKEYGEIYRRKILDEVNEKSS